MFFKFLFSLSASCSCHLIDEFMNIVLNTKSRGLSIPKAIQL